MNRNIEVINLDLWTVDFNLIHYIRGLTFVCNHGDLNSMIASFTIDGKIVLNKGHEAYSEIKMLLQRLMKNRDSDLRKKVIEMRSKERDPTEEFYLFALDLEVKRRSMAKGVACGNPFRSIKQLMKKVVK